MDPIEEVVKELKELNATNKKLLEIQGLDFALEPFRYITRKLRTGEGRPDALGYFQLIAPGATFTITFRNPEGYTWIGVAQSIYVSQSGVIEFTGFMDDGILPSAYIPRLVSGEIKWLQLIPFGHVMKETTTLIYTNHDVADQWISVASMGIFLRKDVWEKDSRLMDLAAEKYMMQIYAPPPMPPPA